MQFPTFSRAKSASPAKFPFNPVKNPFLLKKEKEKEKNTKSPTNSLSSSSSCSSPSSAPVSFQPSSANPDTYGNGNANANANGNTQKLPTPIPPNFSQVIKPHQNDAFFEIPPSQIAECLFSELDMIMDVNTEFPNINSSHLVVIADGIKIPLSCEGPCPFALKIETESHLYIVNLNLKSLFQLDQLLRTRYQPSSLPALRMFSSSASIKNLVQPESVENTDIESIPEEDYQFLTLEYFRTLFSNLNGYSHLKPIVSLILGHGYIIKRQTRSVSQKTEACSVRLTPNMKRKKKGSMEDYQILRVLGKGCMGKVFLVRPVESDRTSLVYALKSISKSWVLRHKELTHALAERQILETISKIRHPFLIQCHEAFTSSTELFLLLEYVGGGDMATQLAKFSKFSAQRTFFYASEILLGVVELHRLGIVYRDLKPENILLKVDGHIVLTDFGLSKKFDQKSDQYDHPGTEQRTKTFAGTAEYLAPEILRGEDYGFGVDWWSFGVLVYEMLAGIIPFWAESKPQMYKRVLEDEIEFSSSFDPVTRNLIKKLLERNPCKRLGSGPKGDEEIKLHPYFDDLNWNAVYQKKLKPPYVPKIRSPFDSSNFESTFTDMAPCLSPPSHVLSTSAQNQFQGYSWAPNGSYVPSSYAGSLSKNSFTDKYSENFFNESNQSFKMKFSGANNTLGVVEEESLEVQNQVFDDPESEWMASKAGFLRNDATPNSSPGSKAAEDSKASIDPANIEVYMDFESTYHPIELDEDFIPKSEDLVTLESFGSAANSPIMGYGNRSDNRDQLSTAYGFATPHSSPLPNDIRSFDQLSHLQTSYQDFHSSVPQNGYGLYTPPMTPPMPSSYVYNNGNSANRHINMMNRSNMNDNQMYSMNNRNSHVRPQVRGVHKGKGRQGYFNGNVYEFFGRGQP